MVIDVKDAKVHLVEIVMGMMIVMVRTKCRIFIAFHLKSLTIIL